jgi:hypothetical protein
MKEHMMDDHKFDEIIRKKINETPLDTTPKGWEKILSELQQSNDKSIAAIATQSKSKSKSIYNWKRAAIAACIVATLIGGITWNNLQTGKYTSTKNTPIASVENNNTTTDHNINSESEILEHNPTTANNTNTYIVSKTKPSTTTTSNSRNYISHNEQENTLQQKVANKINIDNNINANPIKDTKEHFTVSNNNSPFSQQILQTAELYNIEQKEYKALEIGMNGGYNFGNLNTGYAASIKARGHITEDIFIDGSIGIAYNHMAQQTYDIPTANIKARPQASNSNVVNLPAVKNASKELLYMQFNPSVGYKVNNKFSVSAGPDIQQLVKTQGNEFANNNTIFNANTQKTSIIPQTDLGVSTKTEFHINKNLSAGLVYREALNNLFKNASMEAEGVNYINRRYIQIQLSYNIPVKL